MARWHQFERTGYVELPLKTLPRLSGKSTHVIITEYDLPNKLIEPHDVVLDHQGNVWYSDFGQMFIGEMDAKTGAVTQYPIPVTKPGYSLGTLPGSKAVNVASRICIFVILVASYDLMLGFTGIVSFAHTMFFGTCLTAWRSCSPMAGSAGPA